MNKAEKSLRWVMNQIPDFKPATNQQKMLLQINRYSAAGEEENKRLEAQNAAMRKQISEMLTPLCTLGDKLYHYGLSFGDGFDENGKVIHTSSMNTIETEVTRDNIWRMCDLVQNKRAFFSREALVAGFKERFQKGREQFVKELKDDKRRTD